MKQTIRCVSIILGLLIVVGARADEPTRTVPEREILNGFKCVLEGKGTKVSWGCMNSPGGCYGACSEGYYAEPARVCKPAPGSVCAGRKGTIKVIRTNEGVCLRNCSCEELRALPHEPVEIVVYRCN